MRGSYLHDEPLTETLDGRPSKRISLLRTEGEWNHISRLLLDQNNTDLHAWLHREISRLSNKYADCEICITPANGVTKSFRHNIPTHIYNKLIPIALKMRKPVATLIDDLLIMPLLLPDKDAAL